MKSNHFWTGPAYQAAVAATSRDGCYHSPSLAVIERLAVLVREALQLSDDALDYKVIEMARELGIPESEWYAYDSTEVP